MFGMRFMPIGRNNTANHPVIKRKGVEVLGNEDDRVALTFVRAERSLGHYFAGLEAQ